jgi:hypothetical protein
MNDAQLQWLAEELHILADVGLAVCTLLIVLCLLKAIDMVRQDETGPTMAVVVALVLAGGVWVAVAFVRG